MQAPLPTDEKNRIRELETRVVELSAQLREIEELYRSAPVGLAVIDTEHRFVRINEQLARLNGKTVEEHLGRSLREAAPGIAAEVEQLHRRVIETGEPIVDHEIQGSGGGSGLRDWLASCYPVKSNTGSMQAVSLVLRDITERNRAEAERRLLQDITLSIRQAEDLDSALNDVLRSVCDATGWIIGQAWTPNADGTGLTCSAWHSKAAGLEDFRASSDGLSLSRGIGLPGRVWATGRHVWVQDVREDANFPRAAQAREAGLVGAIGIPVLAGADVVLVMEFLVRERRDEDERMVELISAIAAQLGMLMQRKRAEDSLRRTEIEYQSLVESVQAIVWRANCRTFQFSFVSTEAEKLLGYPVDQWLSSATFWPDHIHPDDRDWAVAYCTAATEENRDHVFEYRMIALDGGVVWLRDIVHFLPDSEGGELVGVMVDITERKLAEEALRQSEEKFSTIFQTIPDAVSIIRLRDGMGLDVTDEWTKRTGYLREDRVGKPSSEVNIYVDPAVRDRHYAMLLTEGEFHNCEVEYRMKDGSIRCGLLSARAIELDGELCAVMVARDITEDKAAQKAMLESERKFSTVFETIPDVVMILRLRDGLALDVNDAWIRLTGYEKSERINKSFEDVNLFVDQDVRRKHMAEILEKGEVRNLEGTYRIKDGSLRYALTSARAIELNGEQCAVMVARDITDLKAAETAVRKLNEELEERVNERTRQLGESNAELQTQVAHRRRIEELLRARNDELKAFAYTVSHDLKAPLRGIAGYGQELDRRHMDGLGERAQFCVKQIITAARNLENLIEDLLAYSRLDAEAASMTEVNLPAVVDSILRERARVISDQGVQIEIDIGCPTLRGWQRGLSQVLANLIDNAIKYSRDSKPPRVRIAAEELAGAYQLSVSDNGIGFDLKYKDRIFGLFNRLVRAEEFEGTGAGLAIVRKLVEEQGGRVWPESRPGAGATFFVELPKQKNQGG